MPSGSNCIVPLSTIPAPHPSNQFSRMAETILTISFVFSHLLFSRIIRLTLAVPIYGMEVFKPPDDLLCLHSSEDSVGIFLRFVFIAAISDFLSAAKNPNLRCSPHIYGLAEQCLRYMRETGSHQSIIISGLSGSGKTETAKHSLKYLVRESVRKRHRQTDNPGAGFENELGHILLQSNPILEAFGNAQTIRNNNSSRFGKFMTLFYSTEQVITGATVKVYLLEKPRTLFNDSTICSSFHVFRLVSSINF
ncbi:uncharacterized protein DEA37_0003119 [Paragonimus westermani]|uniref:Myosin motor domain-containing protein n=1 Tax=Paragonimus westermani TaxID=34504 RepID=A0A5J4NNC6_9TREM|nr:uncharacterized protein DEA37_0003119 [Paragonimus westermani]